MWLVDWLLVVGAFVVIQEKSLKWQPSLAAVCVSVVYLYYVVDGGWWMVDRLLGGLEEDLGSLWLLVRVS
jgi:hypothetical protein